MGFDNGVEGAQARFDMSVVGKEGDDRAALRTPRREGAVSFDLGPELVIWGHRTTHLDALGADVHETLSTGLTRVALPVTVRPDQGRLLDGAEVSVRRRVGGLFVSGHRRDRFTNRTAVLRDARARARR